MALALVLELAPAGGGPSAPDAVIDAIYRPIRALIEEFAWRSEDAQVTTDYIVGVRDDCTFDGQTLVFVFRNPGGLCSMACMACHHWFELALTRVPLAGILESVGYRLVKPPATREQALAPPIPFAYVANTLVAFYRRDDGVQLVADDGCEVPPWAELAPDVQARIVTLLEQRRCECSMCDAFSGN